MAIHVRIVQGSDLIADLPAVGDYLFHPPYGDFVPEGIAGCVRVRTWRTHDRSPDPDAKAFIQTARPYVEISI